MFSSLSWCQLLADVTGFPVATSQLAQAPALGAALFTQPNYLDLSERVVFEGVVEPDLEVHARYRNYYLRWAAGDPNAT
jgi:sugar (pentulose or hexulose) kinase